MSHTTKGPETVYLLPGFKERLCEISADDNATFENFSELLVMQPQAILYFLRVVNEECGNMDHKKPTSVYTIIGLLGTNRIEREVAKMSVASRGEEKDLARMAIESYELASVLAYLAEYRLGRNVARDFFLVGLLSELFEKDQDTLKSCHEGIQRSWRSFSPGEKNKGEPMLEEARELADGLRNNKRTSASIRLHEEWSESSRLVREVINSTRNWRTI